MLLDETGYRPYDGSEKKRFTTASKNLSDFDHRSKHCDMTSAAATRLKNAITIVSKNRSEAVLTPFDAALFPS